VQLKRVDDLGLSKADKTFLDDLAFKVAALELAPDPPTLVDALQATPFAVPVSVPLSAFPAILAESRPGRAKRRPSSGNGGLTALRELVGRKADREEVRQLTEMIDAQV
jgi:hypothetical protein